MCRRGLRILRSVELAPHRDQQDEECSPNEKRRRNGNSRHLPPQPRVEQERQKRPGYNRRRTPVHKSPQTEEGLPDVGGSPGALLWPTNTPERPCKNQFRFSPPDSSSRSPMRSTSRAPDGYRGPPRKAELILGYLMYKSDPFGAQHNGSADRCRIDQRLPLDDYADALRPVGSLSPRPGSGCRPFLASPAACMLLGTTRL
jgi:hypothetical protein